MNASVLEGIEASTLYQQTPGILLGLMLVMTAAVLLVIGLGVACESHSNLVTWLGIIALAGAVLVRGMAPETATMLLFWIGSPLALIGSIVLVAVGIKVRSAFA